MTRVLLAIHDLGMGGTERTIVAQANGLTERGFEVMLATFLKNPRQDMGAGSQLPQDHRVAFAFSSHADVQQLRSLAAFLWRWRPDVVVSESLVATVPLKLVKLFVPRFVLIVREGNVLVRHGRLNRLFARCTEWMVDAYVTNALAISHDLAARGVRESKINLMYNGVDARFAAEPKVGRSSTRSQVNVPEGAFMVLHVGSMSTPQKGQDTLIEALASTDGLQDAVAVLVGQGHLRRALEDRAQVLGVFDRVRFIGNRTDVRELMAAADVLAFPSRWEGMPNVVLEAMAARLPVVAASVGGIPELIHGGTHGIEVPPDDAAGLGAGLVAVRRDPAAAGRRAEAAHAFTVANFSWAQNLERLQGLISRYHRSS